MLFNPLGGFVPSAPLSADALLAARKTFFALPSIDAGGITRLYLHWSAGPFACLDANYNLEVDLESGAWVQKITHDPRDNARQIVGDDSYAAHTANRNSNALGLAITGMNEATTTDFGRCPVQLHELEYFCAMVAVTAKKYGIDAVGKVVDGDHAGEPIIATHAECAVFDGYPTERWDFGSLRPLPPGVVMTPSMRTYSANALRQRIHNYKLAF